MALSQNKIVNQERNTPRTPTFERSLVYSLLFHGSLMIVILGSLKFNVSIWKKPIPETSVVWSQTVARPKPTIPDKLPPPLVPIQKPVEIKKEEINIHKVPVPTPEKPKVEEESTKDKMKRALEALRKTITDDDRPAPKEDNFPTQEQKNPEGTLSDSQVLALQSTNIFNAYKQVVKDTVTKNFIWYKSGINFVTIVSMRIDPEGNILNPKIVNSSGDFSYDQATLRALQKSNPLPTPPPELQQMFIQEPVEFNFERKN